MDHPPPHVHVARAGAIVKIDLATLGKEGCRRPSCDPVIVVEHPLVQFTAKSKDGGTLAAGYSMNGKAAEEPTLSGTLVAVEVVRDGFPAVESRGVRLHGPPPY